MKIAILRETWQGERRVALTPDRIAGLREAGAVILVENGAGEAANFDDAAYEAAGATIIHDRQALFEADIIVSIQGPDIADIQTLQSNTILLHLLDAFSKPERAQTLKDKMAQDPSIQLYALEQIPRISRAQSMDILSSQANLAGYKAVLLAFHHFGRVVPMMMTAAGSIAPAKALVMGAGVAGLQAIATAKRLGAVVSATDVRMAAKEQVESLGGKFVTVEDAETADMETSGGYAKEMSDEYKAKQAALIAETIAKQDIVITTALIPNRAAPVLITKQMIETMKPGSVIVDMAITQASQVGGNVEGSRLGEVVEHAGVTIIGPENLPSLIARDASQMFARNIVNFLMPALQEGQINFDHEDEIYCKSLWPQQAPSDRPVSSTTHVSIDENQATGEGQ